MVMAMMVAVGVAMLIVGAVLGIERRFDRRQPRAKPSQHVFDHVVTPDAQPVAGDLHVDVPVADMPRKPRQLTRIRRRDLDKRLGAPDNPDDAAIVKNEAIAVMQGCGLRQIEQKSRTAFAAQDHAAAMAFMGIERDRIDGAGGVPLAGGLDFVRTLHA